MKTQLDTTDLKILKIITNNARMPFKDVAALCDISRAAVHQRVNRLIEMNVIVGSGYIVDPRKVNLNTCTFMGVFLEKGGLYEEVTEYLLNIPEVVECHYTTGQYGLFIKVFAKDNQHLMEVLNGKIQKIPGVASTETIVSLRETFKRTVPLTTD